MADPIDPITVSGIVACWDVDDVVDSSGASSLPDRSGVGNTLSQATAGARLAIVPNDADFNAHKSLQGATGDYILRAALVGGLLAQPFTRYAFIKLGADITTSQCVAGAAVGAAQRGDIVVNNSRLGAYSGTNLYTAASLVANTIGIAKAVFNGASSSIEWSPIGGSVLSATGNAGAQSLVGTTLCALGTGSNPFLGKLPYSILYSGIPSAGDDAGIKAFLLRRFLSFSLTGLDLTSGTPTLDQGALSQSHTLIGLNLDSGVPIIDPGTLSQSHNLTGLDLASGVPIIDPGALSQSHTLTGLYLTSGVPTLDGGTLRRVPNSVPSISQWVKEGPVISSWTKEGPVISEWKVS